MTDPVILCESGWSYERKPIDDWIRRHGTDPRTGRPLRDCRLIENPCLRSLITACVQSLPAAAAAAVRPAGAVAPPGPSESSDDSVAAEPRPAECPRDH
eukprot:CAMPEP_0172173752 /NCGR_PEP_ID=MMETSP1050-20130122/13257_1 /TAXON_ID=233186 /ORGANISM="Cryptomonas curvata, Strain CCAP979/52" /LENGTH=98 /DNA_ID=CAMNT_0012845599 /DNA_START=200 /DNA_END=496 /DNA_ORIENTATION=-